MQQEQLLASETRYDTNWGRNGHEGTCTFGGLRFSIQWEFPLSVETNGTGTCKPAWLSTRLSRDGINGPEKGQPKGL